MKVISKMGAQGDVLFVRVDDAAIPRDAKVVSPADNRFVVAHSETGHHHYLAATGVEMLTLEKDPFTCYLRIESDDAGSVFHARPFDTHETLKLTKGTYMVRRQREYTPQGFRRVED